MRTGIGLQAALSEGRNAPQEIDLAVLEGEDWVPGSGMTRITISSRCGRPGLKYGRVPGQADLGPFRVGDELERPVPTGWRSRRSSGIGALVDVPGNVWAPGGVELQEQRRVGLREPEHHRPLVGRIDAREQAAITPWCGRELEEYLLEANLTSAAVKRAPSAR